MHPGSPCCFCWVSQCVLDAEMADSFSLAEMSAVKRGSHYRGISAGLKLLGSQNDSSNVLIPPCCQFYVPMTLRCISVSFLCSPFRHDHKISQPPNLKCKGDGGNDLNICLPCAFFSLGFYSYSSDAHPGNVRVLRFP